MQISIADYQNIGKEPIDAQHVEWIRNSQMNGYIVKGKQKKCPLLNIFLKGTSILRGNRNEKRFPNKFCV